jgi:transcriptional regulator with XRE-family HTH domain
LLRRTIATNVRALRLERGWTLEQLGRHCRLNVQYLSRLEKTKDVNVTSDNIEKLAKGFAIPIGELVSPNRSLVPSKDVLGQLEQAMQLLQSFYCRVNGD